MQTPIQFTYEDGYVTKISGHQGSNDKTYSYTYDDNGIITDFDYSSYLNNNIMYGGKSYNSTFLSIFQIFVRNLHTTVKAYWKNAYQKIQAETGLWSMMKSIT